MFLITLWLLDKGYDLSVIQSIFCLMNEHHLLLLPALSPINPSSRHTDHPTPFHYLKPFSIFVLGNMWYDRRRIIEGQAKDWYNPLVCSCRGFGQWCTTVEEVQNLHVVTSPWYDLQTSSSFPNGFFMQKLHQFKYRSWWSFLTLTYLTGI